MKTFVSFMILMIGLLVSGPYGNQVQASNPSDQTSFVVDNQSKAPAALVQEEGGVQAEPEQTNVGQESASNFISNNWGALLLGVLGFIDLVARLTPSEKDNSIVNFLVTIFNAVIPNLKKGGGSFRLLSK
jgi:hypothetical protein